MLLGLGQMRFDVKALSEVNNPEQEMNTAINSYQLFVQYITHSAQFMEVVMKLKTNPQEQARIANEMGNLITTSIDGMGKMVTKILESAGAEDAEEYVYRLKEAGVEGQDLIRSAGQRLRGLNEDEGGPAQGAIPGAGLAALPGGAGPLPPRAARAGRSDQPY